MTTSNELNVRSARPLDAQAISSIYNHYVQNTVITFEETLVTVGDIQIRIENLIRVGLPWLVVEDAIKVQGYAYAALC